MKTSRLAFSSKGDWNSGLADPFGQAGGDDDRAALLDDRQAAGQPLDGLVERRVERIAGGGR